MGIPLYLAIPYSIGFVAFWRSFTGHFAWEMHRSAKTNATVRPPVENWLGAAFISLPLALLWFIVMLFVLPWPWTRGAERQEEIKLRGIEYAELVQSNKEADKLLNIGEVLDE